MRIGGFELVEPVPPLREPRLLLALKPWVDVGSAGTLALTLIEGQLDGQELGSLVRPGEYYDFTRYRPVIAYEAGERQVTVPTSVLRLVRGAADLLLLHAMEPHARGEDFCDSVLALVEHFGVTEYLMVGAMYAPVPHTRPPLLSGHSTGELEQRRLASLRIHPSQYEGPTTILATISDQTRALGASAGSLLVQLPAYAQLDTDLRGVAALAGTLSSFYDLELDLEEVRRRGDEQYAEIELAAARNPKLAGWVAELEQMYDRERQEQTPAQPAPPLSPELEAFLRDLEHRLDDE